MGIFEAERAIAQTDIRFGSIRIIEAIGVATGIVIMQQPEVDGESFGNRGCSLRTIPH